MNTFGQIFRLTSFGESHGVALGGVIDGMPAGIDVDLELLDKEMARRRPGQSLLTTPRKEADQVEILSGVFEGKTTGCPIGFMVRNTSQHSSDYDNLRDLFRPSHADFTYFSKYGIRDHRGGGRSSARETVARCVGGAFAKMALAKLGIEVKAFTRQVGTVSLDGTYRDYDLSLTESNDVRCPDVAKAAEMAALIKEVKGVGDTIGGVISCVISGCPVGLGDPVFGRLQSRLAGAMMSINAVKGFEYGLGFEGAKGRGSEQNDVFTTDDGGRIVTLTNRSGGIQGGISNGQDIYFNVAFKPVATLLRDQQTVDLQGRPVEFKARGRHDACVLPRAVPIVEAMAAMVILDSYLINKTVKL
ncbi:MAG: chorismate synthase [Prevotellaceae bacterium]|nr:chorismate synthase [Prevotellaceae bacterium]